MTKNKKICVIDIGTSRVCCIFAQIINGSNFKIIGFSQCKITGVSQLGTLSNMNSLAEAINTTICEAKTQSFVSNIPELYLGLPSSMLNSGQFSISRQIYQSTITSNLVGSMIDDLQTKFSKKYQENKILTCNIYEYILDDKSVNNPVGFSANNFITKSYIMGIDKVHYSNILNCIHNNISVCKLFPSALGVAESCRNLVDNFERERAIIIDMRHFFTDIIFIRNYKISNIITMNKGGNLICDALQKEFNISYNTASTLMLSFKHFIMTPSSFKELQSNSKLSEDISHITLNQLQKEICNQIQITLQEISNKYIDMHKERYNNIILTGEVASIYYTMEIASEVFSEQQIHIGLPSNIDVANTKVDIKQSYFCSIVGLVLIVNKYLSSNLLENLLFIPIKILRNIRSLIYKII